MNPQPKPVKQPKERKPWPRRPPKSSEEKEAAQRDRMRVLFASRAKTAATADFDFPAPNDVIKPLVRGTYGGGVSGIALAKAEKLEGGKDERLHKDSLAAIGCVCCHRLGLTSLSAPIHAPVELHHLRGGGWGKGDYRTLIPLCPEHHRGATGIHGLGTKGFAKQNGFDQQDLLDDALALLANRPRRAE